MSSKNKAVFRVQFQQQNELIELYAHGVSQSSMLGFVEISGLIFDNKTEVVIDPSEEKLKQEFGGVKSSYIPIHSVIRIDEVEKIGVNKIIALDKNKTRNKAVSTFPYSAPRNK